MKRSLLALAFLVGATTLAVGVQPPGGGGRGAGGFGGGSGPAALINSKTVIAEVKITEEQQTELKTWAKGFREKSGEMMKSAMEGLDRSDREAMMQKMSGVQAEITKTAYTELATVLKPEQVERIKQIDLQVQGLAAFRNPETKKALSITDEQTTAIAEAQMASFGEMRELNEEYGVQGFGGAPTDPEKAKEFNAKRAAITKQTTDKVMGLMTAEQKTSYEKLTGAKVDVAKIQAETRGGGQQRKRKIDN